ncbi:O-antigen ligase family protein [Tetragenococcus halophilus]|uniref:O-antigen ligase family protein n=1 Tax=Tetragenococcus halophilus TaxID=51669 RepID=UPI001F4316F9|nr:O-antigen ligase family protein [Tetragenococcus halophilus]MCF1600644.1 O-antigen ligase family protein [Tetragenococcus halophilus]
MIRKNKKDSHSQLFGSMAIAILIGAQYLNTILGLYINSSEEGYLTLIIGIVTILSVISFIYRPNVIVNIKYPALLGIIIVAFLLTVSLTNGKSDLSIADFLGMCLVPLICGGVLKPDFKKVLSYCMCMIILSIPVANDLFAKSNMGQEYDAIKMNVSYAIIPIIGAGILHFFFYRKESNIFEKLLYVVLALITMMFVAMSYRGALVALMVVLFAGFMLSGNIKWRTIKRTISITLCFFIIIFLLLVDINSVLLKVSTFFHSNNINIAFIDKTSFLSSTGSLLHGRLDIWQSAIQGFKESPLYGHGMATFQSYTGYEFPHNIILQFLFDGGLLLAIPLLGYVANGIIRSFTVIRVVNKDKFVLILLLLCISLTRAMMSAEVWRIILLWLFMGMVASDYSKKSRNEIT